MTTVRCQECGRAFNGPQALVDHNRVEHSPEADTIRAAEADGLVWEEPPRQRGGTAKRILSDTVLAALKARPDEWARITEYRATSFNIKGLAKSYPGYEFKTNSMPVADGKRHYRVMNQWITASQPPRRNRRCDGGYAQQTHGWRACEYPERPHTDGGMEFAATHCARCRIVLAAVTATAPDALIEVTDSTTATIIGVDAGTRMAARDISIRFVTILDDRDAVHIRRALAA